MAITFIEGADMSEAKTPLPGEYWVSDDGSLIRIVGVKLNGGVIYENQAGFSFQFNSMTNWRHEPRCTGFDWVEPPAIDPGEGWELLPVGTVLERDDEFLVGTQWVMTGNYGKDTVKGNTYSRKIKPVEPKLLTPGEGYEWVQQDDMIASGDEYRVKGWHSTSAVGIKCKSINTYRRKIKPVESPDDWVEITDRDHKLRHGIDQFNTSIWCRDWSYVYDSCGKTVTQAGFKSARCRRKDLPVLVTCTCPTLDGVPVTGSSCPIHGLPSCELTTAPKRVPVRLWINGDDGVVFQSEVHVNAGDQEIKHDADGFYVTEEE